MKNFNKNLKENIIPKIEIEIKGGNIQAIKSNIPIQCKILDYDNEPNITIQKADIYEPDYIGKLTW